MIKRILTVTLLMSSFIYIYADWIDDISRHAHGKKLNVDEAIKIMGAYVKQEEMEIKELEKNLKTPHEKGFVASVRANHTKIKEGVTEKTLKYHTKVLRFIESLPENKRDRERFAEHLDGIRTANEELAKLKAESSKTCTVREAANNAAGIVGKNLTIETLKQTIQASII